MVSVIRSADERTLAACRSQLERQLGSRQIHVIHEVPFEAALRRCYEIGAGSGNKWMLTVDADVLLLPNAVQELLHAAEAMPVSHTQVEGRVFDNFFGIYRQAGHRLYRTSLLPLALKCLPETGKEIRPEFFTIKELGRRGHPSRHVATVVGIHDFEQNYRDLYRKAVVHAKKHAHLAERLVTRCVSRLHSDKDFLVILKGFWDGLLISGPVPVDARFFDWTVDQTLADLGLCEKQPFNTAAVNCWENWVSSHFEYACQPMETVDLPAVNVSPSLSQRFRELVHARGLLWASRYSIGAVLERIGRQLKA